METRLLQCLHVLCLPTGSPGDESSESASTVDLLRCLGLLQAPAKATDSLRKGLPTSGEARDTLAGWGTICVHQVLTGLSRHSIRNSVESYDVRFPATRAREYPHHTGPLRPLDARPGREGGSGHG